MAAPKTEPQRPLAKPDPQSPPYKWWNWRDGYEADGAPDPRWVKVSDAGEAALRTLGSAAKP